MKRSLFVLAAAVALIGTGVARAADDGATFSFGFEGFPAQVKGNAGDAVTLEGFLTLTSANVPVETDPVLQEGPQGWSYGVQVDGATIDPAYFDVVTPDSDPPDLLGLDLAVDTIKAGKATALTLWKAGFAVFEPGFTDKTPHAGAAVGLVSAIVNNQKVKQVELPNATHRIAKLALKATIPDAAGTIHLEFKGGLIGSGEPVGAVVTYKSASETPALGALDIPIAPKGKEFILSLVGQGMTAVGTQGTYNTYEVKPLANTTAEAYVDVLLATEGLSTPEGPQGWSFGFTNSSEIVADPVQFDPPEGEDAAACLVGFMVPTLKTDALTPTNIDLKKAGFAVAELAYATKKDVRPVGEPPIGVVTAIVLNQKVKQVLSPNTVTSILRIKYTTAVGTEPITATLDIQANLFGSGEPVANVVTYQSASESPTQGIGLKLTFTPVVTPPKDLFIRGDPNNDGKLDIADAIYIVYYSVPGLGDGYTMGCVDSGDANGDAAVNIADAAYLIQYEFRGGPEPVAPFPGCGTVEASTDVTCPAGTTNCPPAP